MVQLSGPLKSIPIFVTLSITINDLMNHVYKAIKALATAEPRKSQSWVVKVGFLMIAVDYRERQYRSAPW